MPFRKQNQKVLHENSWLEVDYRRADIFVRLYGRLDIALRKTIRPTLGQLLNREIEGAICLKMDDVCFLDTSAASALIGFFKDADRYNTIVEVWNAGPIVIRVFERLGVGALLKQ